MGIDKQDDAVPVKADKFSDIRHATIILKIGAFTINNGACQFYRTIQPVTTIGRNSDTLVKIIDSNSGPDDNEAILSADVFVQNGVTDKTTMDILKRIQKEDKKIVLDYDDNLFEVSPLSNHYAHRGLSNVKQLLPDGTEVRLWEDGVKGFDLERNKGSMEAFKKGLSMADAVTVTTPILADVYREYNDNVIVLPNCIDMNVWKPLPLKPRDDIRIGWFGGSSHYEDWVLLENVLPVIMEKYKNVTLVIMGQLFEGTVKNLPQDRIDFHNWIPTPAYPYKAAILDLDIAIIPLRDTKFSRCKSPIKWIEMGALGIPSVASAVSPYKEVAREDNGIFVDNEDDAWIQGISLLIEDSILRARMGGKAFETVKHKFDINTQYYQWLDAYKELVA